ncbi:MAG: hypothetical protein F4X95_04010 [Oligoflexia bacterium]|nr:hypothetical protein [Oligoflexia bacterium]
MNEAAAIAKKEENTRVGRPLVVDLDGTLIKTDLPWESFLSVLVRHPIELIKILIRKIKIKKAGYFKLELEKRACFSLEALPLSKKFVNYLKEEKGRGRELVLCTGSTQTYADKIKKMTGFFDSAWGSTLGKNLVGKKKALFLVEKYGEKNFDYAGNSLADLKIAPYTHFFILVNPSVFTLFLSKKVKVHRLFLKKELNPALFAYTLGLPLWFLNCLIFTLPFFLPAFVPNSYSFPNSFFFLAFSTVHFNFLATAFYVFFSMVYADRDRKKGSMPVGIPNRFAFSSWFFFSRKGRKTMNGANSIPVQYNLFATGDLSLSLGFLLSSVCLLLSLVSLVYLILYSPFSLISTLLYILCTYLLVRGTIIKWKIPIFFRYAFIAKVVLLQGLIISSIERYFINLY